MCVRERLIADGLAGRFPAEEVDIQDWKEMQNLQLKLRKRLNQRAARSAAPAMAEERGGELGADGRLREKREAAPHSRARCCNAGPDREGAL